MKKILNFMIWVLNMESVVALFMVEDFIQIQ